MSSCQHDVHRELQALLVAAGCRTPAEFRRLASEILGREVEPLGRNAIQLCDVEPLMRAINLAAGEARGETP